MSIKTNTVSFVLIALLLAFSFSLEARAFEPGDTAADFTLPGKAGSVQLSSMKGSVVYLDFWASWCGPCRQSFPWMNQIQANYKAQGLRVVAVNLDAKTDAATKFLSQVPAGFTVAFDPNGKTPRVYGVKGMPTSFLIGRDGKILFRHEGFRPDDRAALEQKIQAALEGK